MTCIAWLAETLAREQDWRIDLTPEAGNALRTSPDTPVARQTFANALALAERRYGFAVVRGCPVAAWTDDRAAEAALSIACGLGDLRPQDREGTLLRRVSGSDDQGELSFHCDRCDIALLLYVRTALRGGELRLVSAQSVHDAIAHELPKLAAHLSDPFPVDRRGEQGPEDPPWAMLPIFAWQDNVLISRYNRRLISAAVAKGAPPLSEIQVELLEAIESVLSNPRYAYRYAPHAGDVLLLNNLAVWHARSAYLDAPGEERLAMRVWVAPPSSVTLPESFAFLFGSTSAGVPRGGVPLREALPVG